MIIDARARDNSCRNTLAMKVKQKERRKDIQINALLSRYAISSRTKQGTLHLENDETEKYSLFSLNQAMRTKDNKFS